MCLHLVFVAVVLSLLSLILKYGNTTQIPSNVSKHILIGFQDIWDTMQHVRTVTLISLIHVS